MGRLRPEHFNGQGAICYSYWHSLALGRGLLETLYPRGFPKLGHWWRGTSPEAGIQGHSACWEASAGQSARVSIQ